MIARCEVCDDSQNHDERGCVVCAVLDEKRRTAACERIKRTHAQLKAAGLCITSAKHGAPVPGMTRCARCVEVHRRTA